MIFSGVKSLQIPEGVVTKIMSGALMLWQISGGGGATLYRTDQVNGDIQYLRRSASNGLYATVSGGLKVSSTTASSYHAGIDALGTKISFPNLAASVHQHGGTGFGGYIIYAGGGTTGGETGTAVTSTVNIYDSEMTRTTGTGLSKARRNLMAAHNNGYAIFAGGYGKDKSSDTYLKSLNTVDAYDSTLARTTTTLAAAQYKYAASRAGGYAVTGGYAFDDTLTITKITSGASQDNAAASFGDVALYGGGGTSSLPRDTVRAVDDALTISEITPLGEAKYQLAAAAAGGSVLFGGGSSGSGGTKSVFVYDGQLTRTEADNMSRGRYKFAAAGVGNFAIFANGESSTDINNSESTWDVYKV